MNKLNKTHSKRLWITWGLIFMLGLVNWSCSKDDDINSDEYYVKYEVNSSTIYTGGKLDVVLTNENNENTSLRINTGSQWETVIGPVKKGFKSSLKVNEVGNNYGHLRLYTQISVSKNGSPFALKEINGSDEPRTSVEINYKIDF